VFKPPFAFVLILSSACAAGAADPQENELDGAWLPVKAELAGQEFPEQIRKSIKLEVQGDKYTVTVGKLIDRGVCKLDPAAKPKAIDITSAEGPNKDKTILAIYQRDGDTLKVCYDLSGKQRPTEFKTKEGTELFLVEYQLQKP
jgi:uncharacterized protein (TIGR03067 family)